MVGNLIFEYLLRLAMEVNWTGNNLKCESQLTLNCNINFSTAASDLFSCVAIICLQINWFVVGVIIFQTKKYH